MCQKSYISYGREIFKFLEKLHLNFEILIEEKRKNKEGIIKKNNVEKNSKEGRNTFSAFEIHLVSNRMHAII